VKFVENVKHTMLVSAFLIPVLYSVKLHNNAYKVHLKNLLG